MKIGYSEKLRSNFLIIEDGERLDVDEILRVATMHRCDRVSSKETVVAASFVSRYGDRREAKFMTAEELEAQL